MQSYWIGTTYWVLTLVQCRKVKEVDDLIFYVMVIAHKNVRNLWKRLEYATMHIQALAEFHLIDMCSEFHFHLDFHLVVFG